MEKKKHIETPICKLYGGEVKITVDYARGGEDFVTFVTCREEKLNKCKLSKKEDCIKNNYR